MTKGMEENLNGDNFEFTNYLIAKSHTCHLSSWNELVAQGHIPLSAAGTGEWCLHHIDPTMRYFDLGKYVEWNLSDVVPMKTSFHTKVHKDFERRNAEYGFLDNLMSERMKAACRS